MCIGEFRIKDVLGASLLSFIQSGPFVLYSEVVSWWEPSEIFVFKIKAMLVCFVVHVSDSRFLFSLIAKIQFSSVPDLPVSAACFLCI